MESCFIPIQVQSSHGFRKTGPKKKKKKVPVSTRKENNSTKG